ncbi:MAG: nucleotide exchange factor GrpE [Eubacteriales bacterium]
MDEKTIDQKPDEQKKPETAPESPATENEQQPESPETDVQEAAETDENAGEDGGETAAEPCGRKERKAAAAELKKLRAENAELHAKLAAAETGAEEQKDKYLRTLAEYDNYRKRTAKERENIYSDAASDCIVQLLPLFDNLQRASQFTESDKAAEGVRMILASVPDILGKLDVTSFGTAGDTFDPALHNAVMHVEDEQYGEGEILEVFQPGYRRGDKIIRYAMVKVAN